MNDAVIGGQDAQTDGPGAFRRVTRIVAVVLAAASQLAVGWFTAASGLLAPLWAIVVLGVLWLLSVAVLWATARRKPLATPLVPAVNALLWWAAMSAGEAWLGWTA